MTGLQSDGDITRMRKIGGTGNENVRASLSVGRRIAGIDATGGSDSCRLAAGCGIGGDRAQPFDGHLFELQNVGSGVDPAA